MQVPGRPAPDGAPRAWLTPRVCAAGRGSTAESPAPVARARARTHIRSGVVAKTARLTGPPLLNHAIATRSRRKRSETRWQEPDQTHEPRNATSEQGGGNNRPLASGVGAPSHRSVLSATEVISHVHAHTHTGMLAHYRERVHKSCP